MIRSMKEKMLMDRIKLTELTVNTVIGIWDWEKRHPQKVVFDIEVSTDTVSYTHLTLPTTPYV